MIGLVMRLFSCGPTFEDHPQVFSQKGPAPWILFLTPAPLPLEVTFLVGEGEHMWLYPCASHLKIIPTQLIMVHFFLGFDI